MENRTEKKSSSVSVQGIIGTVLFFLSFLPVIFAVYTSYTGVFFGLQGSAWFFGLPAIIYTLISECMMFFLPVVCLIFQILFFSNYIRKHKKLKFASLILTSLIIIFSLISIVFSEQLLDLKLLTSHSKIRTHMTEVCGEKAASYIGFATESRYEMIYCAHSPILPQDKTFEIRVITNGRIHDNLIDSFTETNKDFMTGLCEYVIAKEGIPSEYRYDIRIVSIDFQDYKYGDDYKALYGRTRYVINGLTKGRYRVTEADVTDIIDQVWKNVFHKVPLNGDRFIIDLSENGDTAVCILIEKNRKSNEIQAEIHDMTSPDFRTPGRFSSIDNKVIPLK